jgi:hypothetical protein
MVKIFLFYLLTNEANIPFLDPACLHKANGHLHLDVQKYFDDEIHELKLKRKMNLKLLKEMNLNWRNQKKTGWKAPKPLTITFDVEKKKLLLSFDYVQRRNDGTIIYCN